MKKGTILFVLTILFVMMIILSLTIVEKNHYKKDNYYNRDDVLNAKQESFAGINTVIIDNCENSEVSILERNDSVIILRNIYHNNIGRIGMKSNDTLYINEDESLDNYIKINLPLNVKNLIVNNGTFTYYLSNSEDKSSLKNWFLNNSRFKICQDKNSTHVSETFVSHNIIAYNSNIDFIDNIIISNPNYQFYNNSSFIAEDNQIRYFDKSVIIGDESTKFNVNGSILKNIKIVPTK